ncbi:hypothetical protein AWM68_17720 [Fictibacillus phosphorivorans]|uniref:Uncharacterized protein n=1 Tax=Fictibacillus phosphorivorans TaxID=1221500 RepID=A0A165NX35_9BACL|nr:hypothetical protein [Fictibacillus phosphorivorans]KZE68010.1 hypothetical protein AWM68_17720 [Fictibacillus phosphorivorans]
MEVRYHFMHKIREAVTNEIILHFMDFKGARIIKLTVEELNATTNKKLKEDARTQWETIQNAHTMKPRA